MAYKFEQLDVWERALDYDQIHGIAEDLPKHERYSDRTADSGPPTAVTRLLVAVLVD